jgi:DEAD/DEAH box helicase domain-containing protein
MSSYRFPALRASLAHGAALETERGGRYNGPMSVETALRAMHADPRFAGCIVHRAEIPPEPAQTAPFPAGLDPRLATALAGLGAPALYTHQAEAVAAALRGDHVAVVTPAASGKTLCYNLPVLHHLLAAPAGRALYLFPTKALAQDQLAELHRLIAALGDPALSAGRPAGAYDGDTPSGQKPRLRDAARIILSNPDMLHAGILPQHTRWAAFFANLQAVVIDEMHTYRGVFGSHVANVLRRLRRICAFYGARPQFLLASATIANPSDLAVRLVEAPVTVIGPERNGAPQGGKTVLFYDPPLVDPSLGIRRSSTLEAADLAAHFLAHDVQTIVFCPTRLSTELTLTYVRERAGPSIGHRLADVRGYRGGYLPDERREIEKGLRQDSVRCVVATNALELGIDIGRLDAAILAGYPGTIAGARQQMGRAGRRQGASAAVLVASANPVDQYIVAHPEYLLGGNPERALINADNEAILASHLACAAAEIPFGPGEPFGTAAGVAALLDDLAEAGQLYAGGGRYFWAGQPAAARQGSPAGFGLRTSSPDRVVIQATDGGALRIIGELERASAPLFLYEGAVYLHEGQTYLVRRLDWEAGVAVVQPDEVDFYTRPTVNEKVAVLEEKAAATVSAYRRAWGDVRVSSQATGYRILRRATNETLGYGPVDLPEQVLETQGCWIAFAPELVEALRESGAWLSDPNDYGPEWPAQRDAVRARDGYRCRACGALELPGRQHDVHHRIPFRAFLADPSLRPGLAAGDAWKAANQPENLVTLCPSCHRRAEAGVRGHSGLEGAANLISGVAPLLLMCDPRDLGRVTEMQAPDTGLPTITLYERVPGGIGYAQELYARMPELLAAAYEVVQRCPCDNGCPSCVGPVLDHAYALETKALATALLKGTL